MFSHSEILGSKVACTSPRLIAACHVLHHIVNQAIRLTVIMKVEPKVQQEYSQNNFYFALAKIVLICVIEYEKIHFEVSKGNF